MSPKILYISPNRDYSGYASAARNYIAALDRVGCNLVTRPLIYDGGQHQLNARELELESRDLQNVKICIQHTTPIEMTARPDIYNVGYFAWETDTLPGPFAQGAQQMDLLLVPCMENLRAARKAGVTKPIEVVPHTFDISRYNHKPSPFNMPGHEDKFKLLTIAQLSKKKGIDSLIKAYLCEFEQHENTLLILKLYISTGDKEDERNQIIELIAKIKDGLRLKTFPEIMLITQIMSEKDIDRLYSTADCYVLPSRGEGWSITAFDAMGFGCPPIVTGWGGPLEFMDNDCGWLVDYTMTPCFGQTMGHDFMYTGKEKWAEPNTCDLMNSMREAHNLWKANKEAGLPEWRKIKDTGRAKVTKFSYDKVGSMMRDIIYKHFNQGK